MSTVDLSDAKWGQVMAILATAPWRDANPLLMEIGEQLRQQHTVAGPPQPSNSPDSNSNSGKEARHE
jgi:hypothetical protein